MAISANMCGPFISMKIREFAAKQNQERDALMPAED
jgi:hypothetical protein